MPKIQKKIFVANIIEEARYGGPQARIVSVSTAIRDNVITTVILPKENSGEFCDKLNECGVSYSTFSLSKISKQPMAVLRYLFLSFVEIIKLAFYFRKMKFDLVHVSGGSWQYKGVIAGKLAGIKVIWHLNDTFAPKIIRFLFYFVSRFSDAFIYASLRSKEYYQPLISREVPGYVIPAPVRTEEFNPCLVDSFSDKRVAEKWKGKIVLGMVANISPVKSIETFIKAANIINRELDNVIFLVVGERHKSQKKYFKRLKKLALDLSVYNIDFIGPMSDVRFFLNTLDIYVCSSDFESSPMSVWEAMSMQKPIVSTNVGDVPRYIVDGVNGFLVGIGDYHMMSKKIIQLINNKSLRSEFGEKARLTAVNSLDVSISAERHIFAYRNTVF